MTGSEIQGYRLSPQQERLWPRVASEPAGKAQCVIEIAGPLDVERLRSSAEHLFARHESLRTSFLRQPGILHPVQRIEAPQAPPWRELDLRAEEPGRRAELLEDAAREERDRPSAAEDGRGGLLAHLEEGRSAFILTVSPLCADAASLRLLFHELVELYDGAPPGRADEEVVQYLQFSEWQNKLREESAEAQERWQRLRQQGAPRLPQERRKGSEERFVPRRRQVGLDPESMAAAAALCARAGIGVDAFFLACWQLLTGRWSGEADPLICTIASGRSFEDLDACVGLLAKPLPVAIHLQGHESFEHLLARAAKAQAEALDLQDDCFWDEGGDIAFEIRDCPAARSSNGVAFSFQQENVDWDRFKLKLLIFQRNDSWSAELWYDASLFEAPTIERMAEHCAIVLRSAAERPDRAIGDIDFLSGAERRHLAAFNGSSRHPADSGVFPLSEPERAGSWLALFEAQAAAAPARPAVVFRGESLSYAELNARANRLARHLRNLGVGPDVRVAVCEDRSLDLVVSLLGILKAGGAYVPLDPNYPPGRLAAMVEDVRVRVVITRVRMEDLPGRVSQVSLATEAPVLAGLAEEDLGVRILPESLAYVLFTSGSTGRPKAVGVEHRQLLRYVVSAAAALGLEPGLSFALVSTPSADLGHTAIFPTLATGGSLHVIPQDLASDPNSFAEHCRNAEIDGLKIVPSHLEALLSAVHPEQVLPRKVLVLGGEASSWRLMERIRSLAPSCRVFNHYGPTEATVGVLVRPVPEEQGTGHVPLGLPLAHGEVFVLDDHLRPVPWEIPGEIYLGGGGLARGYLGQPAATAERFIPHPFAMEPGSRLYRTGDRARFGAGCELEFLGRTDHQIKLRGFRIELGEIEAVLETYPGVQEAVVIVREDRPGERRLVGYVVAPRLGPDAEALRAHARTKLPEPMIPVAIVLLDRLPLTANGKLDRASLPAPEQAATRKKEYVAPRSEVEGRLAAIWTEILGVERVGILDNFFELGGDSIQAIQAVARANRQGLSIRARQLFQLRTLEELAAVAELEVPSLGEQEVLHGKVPLTPIQRWFFEQRFGSFHYWNQTLMLSSSEELDPRLLGQALWHLLAHHDALRLRFEPEVEGWRQHYAELDPQQSSPVPCVDLTGIPDDCQMAVLEAASNEAQASLDPVHGPLTRWVLYRLGWRRSRLLMVFHHLVIDGVSWRILLEDLLEAYEQLRRGEAVRLRAKTTSFRTWGQKLEEHSRSPAVTEELPYWLSVAGQSEPLPMDRAGGENTVASAKTVAVALDETETEILLRESAPAYRADLQEILLTALALQLRAWTGSPRLRVELEGMGREELFEDVDLSRTVGWFTVHYPVLLDVGDEEDPVRALTRIKEQLRAVPGRGIGYGLLRHLRPAGAEVERLRQLPESEISFNYLGQMDGTLPSSSPLWLAPAGKGADRDPADGRPFPLELIVHVLGGRLEALWVYSESLHDRSTIEEQARGFEERLRLLVEGARSAQVDVNPADFPLAGVSERELNTISSLLTEIDEL